MAKFRAPSTSVASSTPSAATHAAHPKVTKPRKQCTRTPLHKKKLHRVRISAKIAAKRACAGRRLINFDTVYVGNLGPSVDEDALRAYFGPCGDIKSVRIHCTGGVAMTVQTPPAEYHENKEVRQFAVVIFESSNGRDKACTLRGSLGGKQLAVCICVSDLPEVQQMIKGRMDEYQAMQDPHQFRKAAAKPLQAESTEALEDERMLHKRFEIMGISFRETIM